MEYPGAPGGVSVATLPYPRYNVRADLVLGGVFNVVDNEDGNGSPAGSKLQAKLLRESGEEGGRGRLRGGATVIGAGGEPRLWGSVIQDKGIGSREAGLVENCATGAFGKVLVCKGLHGYIRKAQ